MIQVRQWKADVGVVWGGEPRIPPNRATRRGRTHQGFLSSCGALDADLHRGILKPSLRVL